MDVPGPSASSSPTLVESLGASRKIYSPCDETAIEDHGQSITADLDSSDYEEVETTGAEVDYERIRKYEAVRSVRIVMKQRVPVEILIKAIQEKLGGKECVQQVCYHPRFVVEVGLSSVQDKERLVGQVINIGDEELISSVMKQYGKVINILANYYHNTRVKTGSFRVVMLTRQKIPNYIEILGQFVPLFYVGLKKECRRCGNPDHEIRNCSVKACFRCHSVNHLISNCPVCYNCHQMHKNDEKCPIVSYAEIIKKGPRKHSLERKRARSLEKKYEKFVRNNKDSEGERQSGVEVTDEETQSVVEVNNEERQSNVELLEDDNKQQEMEIDIQQRKGKKEKSSGKRKIGGIEDGSVKKIVTEIEGQNLLEETVLECSNPTPYLKNVAGTTVVMRKKSRTQKKNNDG
ncbi:uncharacterized protein LOC111627385 isoform X2 [Centruroides sculpturatus]|uniref:uncharacterized protein LOC111627385 isoform X2 n=1 Tax=Centruroides sculpturatus TaxID=218467 RepID=UPI000C6E3FF1|nr:uncharacterized protein LOC111627385 isoform X2 [Centruroides sculpturatus]